MVLQRAQWVFWDWNTPMLHYNCRSTLIPIYTNRKETKDLSLPAVQSGFGHNLYSRGSFWMLSKNMVKRVNKYGIGGDIV